MTAVALVCRFYGFSLDAVMAMTLRQFAGLLFEVAVILKMEYGGDTKKSRAGSVEMTKELAQRIVGKKKRK